MLAALHLHFRRLAFFAVLSFLDLVLTCQLVQGNGGVVYESNPVAGAWLATYGWVGLVIFKVGMVALIALTALVISVYRPRTSARLLGFACGVTLAVVAYSFYLTQVMAGAAHEFRVQDAAGGQDELALVGWAENRGRHQRYVDLMGQLSDDLVSGRATLAEAADRLGALRGHGSAWLRGYRRSFPGLSEREYLAIHLMNYAAAGPAAAPPDAVRTLAGQYEAEFGRPAPLDLGVARADASAGGG